MRSHLVPGCASADDGDVCPTVCFSLELFFGDSRKYSRDCVRVPCTATGGSVTTDLGCCCASQDGVYWCGCVLTKPDIRRLKWSQRLKNQCTINTYLVPTAVLLFSVRCSTSVVSRRRQSLCAIVANIPSISPAMIKNPSSWCTTTAVCVPLSHSVPCSSAIHIHIYCVSLTFHK